MPWNRMKRFFSGREEPEPERPAVQWIEASDNGFGVRMLDVRPITQTMILASGVKEHAANAGSFGQDDGTVFIGQEPREERVVEASVRFPVDRVLADGVLFAPQEMEHKWAIFHHGGRIYFVRSWTREVVAVADLVQRDDHVEITSIRGTLAYEDESAEYTARLVDFLLRSHGLRVVHPAPLPPPEDGMSPEDAARWCLSMFGRLAWCATWEEVRELAPDRPLRSNSLLHIAVARGDRAGIEEQLAAGVPIDLLATDGLAPLHWALTCPDTSIMELLLERGSPVDVRSAEEATPLMNAVQEGSVERVSLLLDHGAEIDAQDHRGFTSLHRAAERGHVEIARALLERGGSASIAAEGHTPLSLSEGRGHAEIVKLLGEHGAGTDSPR